MKFHKVTGTLPANVTVEIGQSFSMVDNFLTGFFNPPGFASPPKTVRVPAKPNTLSISVQDEDAKSVAATLRAMAEELEA